jgi:prepilin-type processing-associated H-X9-DG protein
MPRFSIRKMMRAIALIAVALSIVVLVARSYNERARDGRRYRCAGHVKSIVLAILVRENSAKTLPAGTSPNPNLVPRDRLSWYAEILPYLEYDLRSSMELTQPWDVGINYSIACTSIGITRCPDSPAIPSSPVPATYIGIAGLGTDAPVLPKDDPRAGVFGYDRRTTIAEIKDGLATTMLIAETGRVTGSWLAGGPATVRGLNPDEKPYLGPGRQFGGMHPGGANIGFADGSVRFVSESIDPKVFEALSTIAGGEKIPDWTLE